MPDIPDTQEVRRIVSEVIEEKNKAAGVKLDMLRDEVYVLKPWLSLSEAVEYVGRAWKRETLRKIAKSGKVRAVKRHRRWFIKRESLNTYIEQGTDTTTGAG